VPFPNNVVYVNFASSLDFTSDARMVLSQLNFRFILPDGSFEQRFEQRGVVSYYSGNGSFSGHWVTLKGSRIFENQTLVRFSNYACHTGHPIGE
jgi:hypothetical protein